MSSGKQGSIDSSKVLTEVLVLPEPRAPNKRQKEPARAKCVTDDSVLELKAKEKDREEAKKAKAFEREQKKKERETRKKD